MSHTTNQTLSKLLETCEDSRKAFATAASAIEDDSLRSYFAQWAEQRKHFCTQLRNLMTMLDANPISVQFETGSIAGVLQRAWMHLASALTSSDDVAVLQACETGETWTREVYKQAVESEMPDEVRNVIEEQCAEVVKVQVMLSKLKSEVAATEVT